MTCELNTNSLRILTVVCGDPNRLTALTNNYLAEPQGAPSVNNRSSCSEQVMRKIQNSYLRATA